ncbi:Outer membrane porin protein 32 [Paraburkholderia caffeinitolerans]|uniref:Outer membrane porin protein 32 n=1 Tax=Paraburkholderia caffeinitolerans TaxID=1723730 RepID=A0A6J5GC49_9BURK|nr:porin [Paraburkholderia caffeinitolerans]CAB3797919.1 Outer membrane porin protein 32 [Paraburkholderia caffeinitolerans]
MKHFIAAGLTGICAVSSAWAQSSVTLYGSLDAGVAYISNVGGQSKWMMEQGNTQPDRWGLRGQEDLGSGLKAIFQLENGFYTNTGAMAKANTLFNRQAFVGLTSDKFGSLTLGHQTPFSFDVLDPFSTAYLGQSWYAFHPGNIDELADTGVVPYDNSVKYRSPTWYGFSAGAMLGFGNTTNFSTGRTMGFSLSYANGPFKAGATWSNEHDRSVAIATTGIVPTFQGQPSATYMADKVENMGAGASYSFGKLLVHGLYTRTKLESNGHSDTFQSYDAGANYQFTAFNSVVGGAATSTLDGRRWTQVMIGDVYSLSKRTQVYVNALYERANSEANAAFFTAGVSSGRNQAIVLAGIHHSF